MIDDARHLADAAADVGYGLAVADGAALFECGTGVADEPPKRERLAGPEYATVDALGYGADVEQLVVEGLGGHDSLRYADGVRHRHRGDARLGDPEYLARQ